MHAKTSTTHDKIKTGRRPMASANGMPMMLPMPMKRVG